MSWKNKDFYGGVVEPDGEGEFEQFGLSELESQLRKAQLVVRRVFGNSDEALAAMPVVIEELLEYDYKDDITGGEWER